jgi:polyhydroxybutyrate depolymerase
MTVHQRRPSKINRVPPAGRAARPVAAALAASLVLALSCSLARPGPGPGTIEVTLQSGGSERTFLLHVPPSAVPGTELPVVLLFHGRYGTSAGLEEQTGFSTIADREGFVAVYPQGEGRRWSDGRQGEDWKDIVFVCAILDTLDSFCSCDSTRVFAAGMSNGAFFCNYLAGNRPDLIRAIAPVAGGMACPWPGGFSPEGHVSVLMINGTADPLVPWEGGEVGYERSRRDQGFMYPVEEAFGMWAEACGCTAPADTVDMPDADPADGCTCRRISWQPAGDGTMVELIRVDGGGHTWPGLEDGLGEGLVGLTCMDFDSPEAIWEFFDSVPAGSDGTASRGQGSRR